MSKNESREDRSVENEIKAYGSGYVIKTIMEKKGIAIAKLCTDIGTSKYDVAISPSMMSRMLSGDCGLRDDFISMILNVAGITWEEYGKGMDKLTEDSMKSGRLYYKRPYHPKKDKKEDDN